jgi:hypothetical protein
MKRVILLFLIVVTIAYALTSSKAKKRKLKLATLKKSLAPRKSIQQIPVFGNEIRDEIRDEPPNENPWSEQFGSGDGGYEQGDYEPSPWNVQMTNDEGYSDEETPLRLPIISSETFRRDMNTIAKMRV